MNNSWPYFLPSACMQPHFQLYVILLQCCVVNFNLLWRQLWGCCRVPNSSNHK